MNVYDFDKTIYDGDSSIDFFKFCIKKNKKCLLILPKLLFVICFYLIKIYEKEKLKSCFFSFVKYFKNINKVVIEFWESKNYKLKQFYLDQKKTTDMIVSASPEFLLKPVAKKYNFNLIATKVDEKTGILLGNNCYGEEKVQRMKEQKILTYNNFYSDSLSDEPLSRYAKNAYIVKGTQIINWNNYKESFPKKIKKMLFSRDFITFVAIGLINVINGVWIAYCYSLFITDAIVAYILGFISSLCIAYILNTLLNFKTKISIKKFLKFAINNIPNFLIQILSVVILINILEWSKLISYAISATIAVPITFILVKINVFK